MTYSRAPMGSRWRLLRRLRRRRSTCPRTFFPRVRPSLWLRRIPRSRPRRPLQRAPLKPLRRSPRRPLRRSVSRKLRPRTTQRPASRRTQSTRHTRGRAIPRVTPHTRPKRLRSPKKKSRPLAVAITGGIGAGKSETLAAFARHGAATISSDEVVHELYEDPEVQSALVERFGTSDRREVGKQAVGDRDALIWLEQLLHPRVIEHTEA